MIRTEPPHPSHPTRTPSLLDEAAGASETAAAVSIQELFARQAARTPEALAVLGCHGERLTYRELDLRAEHLARYLAGLGVGRETPVAVSLPRSPEMA